MGEHDFWQAIPERMRAIARRFGDGSLVALRYPNLHALHGAILLTSLAIVWLGLELVTG